ncbi:MAG: UvrD-helicase domain-containing protein [Chloroflexota bacterium]|nr:UvrD-helicase domain-containing protein [Chloroflexota bacterium]MDE2941377.1 UvrD-helicase domain-containing protein [Chloroflexota bacterium]MDE3267476.1 UvrD-helicase domain-containing protein [Chloroflexota bacterium]
MTTDLLAGLNEAQREAVEAVDGPLLILAGPGSGKTRVITHRIAYMIRSLDVSPRSVAAVTFTNKAAREMRERLFGRSEHDPASPLLPGMWNYRHEFTVSTFHALCAQILRREALHAGLESTFVIYDQEDQLEAVKQAMEIQEIDPKRFSPRSVLNAISAAKSSLIEPEAFAAARSTFADEIVSRIYRQYQGLLSRNNALDFDDLLLKAYALFRDNAQVLDKYRSRYEYLLIDEFQDTNVAQYAIARQLAGKHRNICVVGDPDQAIYSWRNADIRNILSFQRDYPDARTVTLGENYRSTSTILDGATGVISANNRRIDRPLTTSNGRGDPILVGEAYTPEEEAQQVLGEIQRLRKDSGHSLGDCAVMYRVNAQSRALEDGCLRRSIPYKLIGGVRFYQRREVKDVIAYLRVVQNPYDDVSLLRIINVPPRGIGQRTVEQLVHDARVQGIPVYAAAQLAAEAEQQGQSSRDRGSRTGRAVSRFLYVVNALIESAGSLQIEELIDAIMERTGYREHLRAEGDQGQERLENIAELRATARELQPMEPSERLAAFLEGAALVSDVDALEEGEDAITLITLHQAKGLEFPVVFIVGLEEGMLPHIRSFDDPEQMEEERRLFYVGMTRAKERLYLTRSFRRDFRGGSGASRPSRFLSDVPQSLVSSLAMAGRRSAVTPLGARPAYQGSAAAEPSGEPPLKSGERVRHARFGDGIVVSCVPSGTDHEVTVAFKGSSGIKRLLYTFASLERLE